MTKDFYFNTAEAMDKAKADRDKPVTPVEYIPVISEVGSDSNMVFPDTMYGLLPKGTGKITLHESKPAQQPDVDAIVALARADEREACARIVEESSLPDSYSEACLPEIAAAIRARGNT
jgi:hypothetical protein